jgi:multidrug efflux pump subunit AcrA (membrane-fusion protein)
VLIGVAVVVVLGGAGGFVYSRVGGAAAVTYRTEAAVLGTVTQTISLSGNLTPTDETNLDFGSSGKVTAVDVQPGNSVTAGETLATIDPTALQAQLASAQANLASAQAKLALDQAGSSIASDRQSLANAQTSLTDTTTSDTLKISQAQAAVTTAQSEYTTDGCGTSSPLPACTSPNGGDDQTLQNAESTLQSTQLSAQQSLDQAEAQVTSAQDQLSTAEAQQPAQIELDQASVQEDQVTVSADQAAVAGATLTAPAAGEVAEVNISVGESVSGSSSSGSSGGSSGSSSASGSSGSSSSTYAIVVITPGLFSVTGSVSDAQVDEIVNGLAAEITPAGSTEAYPGTVTEVAPVATISSGVATFPVTVTISGTHPELKSGMSASVSVIVNQVSQVLTVPTSAVTTAGSGSTVQVLADGAPETVAVTVGASDAERTQILSGLNAGEQVVIARITATIPSSSSSSGRSFSGLGGGGFSGGRTTVIPGG